MKRLFFIIINILCINLVETHAQAFQAELTDSGAKLGPAAKLPEGFVGTFLSHQIQRQQAVATDDKSLQIDGFTVDTETRLGNLVDFHTHYSVPEDADPIGWTGSVASCDPGTIAASYQDLVRRRINYFRGQAGLSTDITFDSAKNEASQQAALVMVRQKNLSHTPYRDWPSNPCVTQASEVTASAANLALGSYGLDSIDRLILDDGGNNGPVGHRRWFLYPQATEMGHGSIPHVPNYTSGCVVWVVGDFGPVPAAKATMWPNAGYCPYTLVPNNNATYARWSFSYPQADFSEATVSVTLDGEDITTTLEPVQGFIGDNTLVWRVQGIPITPPAANTDAVANVTISGIGNAPFTDYTYNVIIYDPFDLQQDLLVQGPDAPSVTGGSVYSFNTIESAESYSLRIANQAPATWIEGAEALDTIIDGTASSYSLSTNALQSGGSKSFQLVFPAYGEQSFEIDRTVIPSKDSVLSFKRRFRFFYPHSRFYAEISDNEGASWTPLYNAPGTNVIGSSSEWDSTWIQINQAIPEDYEGRPIRVRFRIATGGSFYQWNPGNTVAHYGVFIDDVQVTDASQILNEKTTLLAGDEKSFALDNSTAGAELSTESTYLIQVAPIVGGHQFSYTSPFIVQPTLLDEKVIWQEAHFGSPETTNLTAPQADFDADGISNLVERALGLDPTQADHEMADGALPSGDLGESGRPALGLAIPTNPHADLTFEVQQSSDLAVWTPLARKVGGADWNIITPGVTIEEGPEVDGRTPLTIAAPAMVTGNGSLHLRLSVSTLD